MTLAEKTLNLPRAKDLKSNKLKDIQAHLAILYDALDRSYRLTFQDIAILTPGTAVGQILYWDGFKWIKAETSDLVWDPTNETFGIGTASPDQGAKLDVRGTVMVTRLLAGGISEF